MSDAVSRRTGFSDVDRQADPQMLVDSMEATAGWPAVQRLRAWERERLRVGPGDAVLDVGCGTGDVLVQYAMLTRPDGTAAGLDASNEMLAAARRRAADHDVALDLQVGDATALPYDDGTFDAVRSERTLQWVPDAATAVREMVRVLKPGGRICVTDTDWRTMLIDHPEPGEFRLFMDAMTAVRGDQMRVGARLLNLLRDSGIGEVQPGAETHIWSSWDPSTSPAPAGMVPLRFLAKDLVETGLLERERTERLMDAFEQGARDDRLFASLTMFAAAGTKPRSAVTP